MHHMVRLYSGSSHHYVRCPPFYEVRGRDVHPPLVYCFPIVPVHSINLQAGTLSVLKDALFINSVTNVALDRWYYLWIHVSTQSSPILQMELKGDCKRILLGQGTIWKQSLFYTIWSNSEQDTTGLTSQSEHGLRKDLSAAVLFPLPLN